MIIVRRLLLLCAITLSLATTAFAGREDTSSCIRIGDYTIECVGPDSQGMMTYTVRFQFSYVKPGTNFIRIYESGTQGSVYTYPFKQNSQAVTFKRHQENWPWACFTIDVYDVLPNGKVVKCSTTFCNYFWCGNGWTKDVVAGQSQQVEVPTLALAPNPAMDVVDVSVGVPSYDPSSSLDILDMNGNVVATIATAMPQGSIEIPAQLDNLPSGVYMVRMTHVSGIVVSPLQVIR